MPSGGYRVLPRKLSGLHCLTCLYKVAIQGATQGATFSFLATCPERFRDWR